MADGGEQSYGERAQLLSSRSHGDRELRSNERVRRFENGIVVEEPAPPRLDCHYLITAWSPAAVTPQVESTLDEHGLLYRATTVLMNAAPLVPRLVFEPTEPVPAALEPIADAELPTQILPVEGFPKYGEFWNTMGTNHRWKPAIYFIVTLPVLVPIEESGFMVTTRITEYRQAGNPTTAEIWYQIGGHVVDSLSPLPDGTPSPVVGAWVELQTDVGERLQIVQTDAQGRFTFLMLRAGSYQLRTQGTGQGDVTRPIDVPSPTGEYDIVFT